MKVHLLRILTMVGICFIVSEQALFSQTFVTIGTATTTTFYNPIYMSGIGTPTSYSNSISLFTPAEIGMAGNIISLAWNKSDNLGYPTNDGQLKIYVKHTTAISVPTLAGTFTSVVCLWSWIGRIWNFKYSIFTVGC